MVDLLKLIFCLEELSFYAKIYFKIITPLSIASPSKIESSVKSKCEKSKCEIWGSLLLVLALESFHLSSLILSKKITLIHKLRIIRGLKGYFDEAFYQV